MLDVVCPACAAQLTEWNESWLSRCRGNQPCLSPPRPPQRQLEFVQSFPTKTYADKFSQP